MTRADLDRLVAAVDEATAESALVIGITRAATNDWRAAAWILERRWPSHWAAGRLVDDEDDDY